MKKLSDLSDQEISQHMDFDGLITQQKSIIKTKAYWKWGALGSGVVLILAVLLYPRTEHIPQATILQKSTPPPSSNEVKDSVMKDKLDKLPKKDKAPTVMHAVDPKDDLPVVDTPRGEVTPVYRQAEPVDGYPALYEYFNSSLVYPVDAPSDTIQGVLTVTFIINADGNPENISIQNSLGKTFEREAIRLILEMPEWKPAQLDNKPVPSKMSLPLTFRIKEEKL